VAGTGGGGLLGALRHDPLPIGLVAAGLLLGTYAVLGIPVSPFLITAGICGAALVYWADRVLGFSPEDRYAHPDRVAWVDAHRPWLWVEAVGLVVIGGVSLTWLRPETIVGAVIFGGISLVHVVPVLPGKRRVKALKWGKRSSIAAAWALGAVLLPWLEAGRLDTSVWLLAGLVASRFAAVWANLVMADWADRPGDHTAGLPTLSAPSEQAVRVRATVATAGSGVLIAVLGGAGMIPLVLATAGSGVLIAVLGGAGMIPLALAAVEAAGALALTVAVWTVQPRRYRHHLLVLDALIGWPVLTYVATLV
jgi:hypothetical protein